MEEQKGTVTRGKYVDHFSPAVRPRPDPRLGWFFPGGFTENVLFSNF